MFPPKDDRSTKYPAPASTPAVSAMRPYRGVPSAAVKLTPGIIERKLETMPEGEGRLERKDEIKDPTDHEAVGPDIVGQQSAQV